MHRTDPCIEPRPTTGHQALLFDDQAGPAPAPVDAPKPDRRPSVAKRAAATEWPKSTFSIECQLPQCVVRYFPKLAPTLGRAIGSAEGWIRFIDALYEGEDERYPAVLADLRRAIAAAGAVVPPRALEPDAAALAEDGYHADGTVA